MSTGGTILKEKCRTILISDLRESPVRFISEKEYCGVLFLTVKFISGVGFCKVRTLSTGFKITFSKSFAFNY